MKICPKCQVEHNKKGKFCSRSCANSRDWSEEDKIKKSTAAKDYLSNLTDSESIIVKDRLRKNAKRMLETRVSKIDYLLNTHFDLLAWQSKRKRVILEQDFKCLHCGIETWQGQQITLEIDHIDGDRTNDKRENLRGLCPNCHSLTVTWRGRKNNKSTPQNKLKALKESI